MKCNDCKDKDHEFYIPKKFYDQLEVRFEELSHKNLVWKSFYNGALEGLALAYGIGIICVKEKK